MNSMYIDLYVPRVLASAYEVVRENRRRELWSHHAFEFAEGFIPADMVPSYKYRRVLRLLYA